jgi:hypothetical protein
MTSRVRVCRTCSSTNIVPLNSPAGKRIQLQQGLTNADLSTKSVKAPPPSAVKMYRVAKDGNDLGEMSEQTIKSMIQQGILTPQDYSYDYASEDWVPLERIIK